MGVFRDMSKTRENTVRVHFFERDFAVNVVGVSEDENFWCSSEYDANNAWNWYVNNNNANINNNDKNNEYFVRAFCRVQVAG